MRIGTCALILAAVLFGVCGLAVNGRDAKKTLGREVRMAALEVRVAALEAANADLLSKYQHHEKVFSAMGPIVKEVELVTKKDLGERKWKRTIEKIANDGKKGEWPL